jgi:hypothetical protein
MNIKKEIKDFISKEKEKSICLFCKIPYNKDFTAGCIDNQDEIGVIFCCKKCFNNREMEKLLESHCKKKNIKLKVTYAGK